MGFPRWKYEPSKAGIAYLHLTLWSSLITLVLAVYILAQGSSDSTLVPCAVLLMLGSTASFAYVLFHEYHAHRRIRLIQSKEVFSTVRRPVHWATRLSIVLAMLWLLSSGWNMIIAARQPICLESGQIANLWQMGGTCKAQRAGAAFSIINLLTAWAFFAHMATTRDPFDIHLLGKFKDRPITLTPYRFSRTSREKPNLTHKNSDSSVESWSEKPLPRTPSTKSRPPTPRPLTPTGGGIGLGIVSPITFGPSSPPTSPSRPASVHNHKRTSSVYSRTPSLPQHWAPNDSTTTLRGFTPMKDLRRPPPAATADSAWRALHPPANHFRHVSGSSPMLRPATAQGLASIRTVPDSPLLNANAPRSPSVSAYGQARGHRRNKSAPYTAISIPNLQIDTTHTRSPSLSASSISAPRKRGHIRCTSDPNEMISAHLAAEMDLASRLDRKLQEVGARLEAQAQKGSETTSGSGSAGQGAGMSESGKSSESAAETERSVLVGGGKGMEGRLFAKMEWDVLMGKEVIL